MSIFKQSAAWKFAKQTAVNPVRRTALKIAGLNRVPLTWCRCPNWGDALSPVLVELLSGRRAMHVLGQHHHRYLVIGSILGHANERAEVWGSGFIREDEPVLARPGAIHAVRGPLSRAGLLAQGIECPEVYGDPALLLPQFYNPDIPKQYEVGLIPHYKDKNHPWLEPYRHDPKVRIIDVESGISRFVQEVKSCGLIVSSSLHGIICADAYEIPVLWIELSDNVIGKGFKFLDYFGSIQCEVSAPIVPYGNKTLAEVTALYRPYRVQIDLGRLLLACPFLSAEERRRHEEKTIVIK